jgi:hypothetical protein
MYDVPWQQDLKEGWTCIKVFTFHPQIFTAIFYTVVHIVPHPILYHPHCFPIPANYTSSVSLLGHGDP